MGGPVRKISKPAMIKRNRQIGNYSQLAAFAVLIGGIVLTYNERYVQLALFAPLLALFMTMIGSAFTNRWGRTPPPDQAVDDLLKGLDDQYTIVHYRLRADHALFTPNGILAILGKYETGKITFDGKKWKQSGVSWIRKLFRTEDIGDPVDDSRFEAERLGCALKKILKTGEIPPIRPVVVFTDERARIEAEASPVPALHASKVKEYVRRLPKNPTLRPEQCRRVLEYIGET
jgi:hypothetical protein